MFLLEETYRAIAHLRGEYIFDKWMLWLSFQKYESVDAKSQRCEKAVWSGSSQLKGEVGSERGRQVHTKPAEEESLYTRGSHCHLMGYDGRFSLSTWQNLESPRRQASGGTFVGNELNYDNEVERHTHTHLNRGQGHSLCRHGLTNKETTSRETHSIGFISPAPRLGQCHYSLHPGSCHHNFPTMMCLWTVDQKKPFLLLKLFLSECFTIATEKGAVTRKGHADPCLNHVRKDGDQGMGSQGVLMGNCSWGSVPVHKRTTHCRADCEGVAMAQPVKADVINQGWQFSQKNELSHLK